MTKNESWSPPAHLPRRPTPEETARVEAALPPTRWGRRPKILWVQRLESVTVERGVGASAELLATSHKDYEELEDLDLEIGWRRLLALSQAEGYRDHAPVSAAIKQALEEAQAWLSSWRGDREDVRLQPRGESVAIVQQGAQRVALGLESGEILGQWRFDPLRRYHRSLREMSWAQRLVMGLLVSSASIGIFLASLLHDFLGPAGLLALVLTAGVVALFVRAAKRGGDTN